LIFFFFESDFANVGYDNNVLYDNKVFRDTVAIPIDDVETGQQLVSECPLITEESNVRFWPKADTDNGISDPESLHPLVFGLLSVCFRP
jgi:hypothetical protein